MENKSVTEKFNRADTAKECAADTTMTAVICYEVTREIQKKMEELQELADKLTTTYKKEFIIQDLGIMCVCYQLTHILILRHCQCVSSVLSLQQNVI